MLLPSLLLSLLLMLMPYMNERSCRWLRREHGMITEEHVIRGQVLVQVPSSVMMTWDTARESPLCGAVVKEAELTEWQVSWQRPQHAAPAELARDMELRLDCALSTGLCAAPCSAAGTSMLHIRSTAAQLLQWCMMPGGSHQHQHQPHVLLTLVPLLTPCSCAPAGADPPAAVRACCGR